MPMNEFILQLVGNATPRNLFGVLVDLVLILLFFGFFRIFATRLLRFLPREGMFASWSKDVDALSKRLLGLGTAGALVGAVILNVWLIQSGRDVLDVKLTWIGQVWEQHRATIALYSGTAFIAVVVNLALLQIVNKLLVVLSKWAQNIDTIKGNDLAVAASFEVLRWGIERASWLFLLAFGTAKLPFLPETIPALIYVGLRVLIIYTIARLLWSSLEIVVTTLDGLAKKAAERSENLRYYETLKPLFPTLRRALEATILVLGTAFAVAQVQAFQTLAGFGAVGVKIVGMLFAAQVGSTLLEFVLRELFISKGTLDPDEKQRRLTVLPLIASIAKYIIFGFVIVMSLSQVGIDPMPVLAGAGVAGVAVGFGAQSLITDLVSGLFILWENYFIVGDYIAIGEREGVVEAISLRVTRLRDDEGRVHIVPNGKIEGIVNYSKDYVAAEVGVGVSYEMDLDKVYEALEEVSAWVVENVPDALKPPKIEGVDEFGDSAVVVKLSTTVKPGKHTSTARIVRKRIKEVFDRRGIEIAYPRRVIYFHSQGSQEFVNHLNDTLNGGNVGTTKGRGVNTPLYVSK
jgi:moderate conductance mechanosensitive channel